MRDQFFDMASRGVKRSAEATANEVCKLRKEMEELRELLNKSEGRVKKSQWSESLEAGEIPDGEAPRTAPGAGDLDDLFSEGEEGEDTAEPSEVDDIVTWHSTHIRCTVTHAGLSCKISLDRTCSR